MTKKRILGCLRVPPVEYHCNTPSSELFIDALLSIQITNFNTEHYVEGDLTLTTFGMKTKPDQIKFSLNV
jgi:hypothetical protein